MPRKLKTKIAQVEQPAPIEPEILGPEQEESAPDVVAELEAGVTVLPPEEVEALGKESAAAALPEEFTPEETPELAEEPAGPVVSFDPLQLYLREISQYPPLSKEEEHKLAVRYHESKDVDAAYKLVVSNLKLVVMLAREYQKAARNLLDLVQEGNIGLMEAVKNFDPYRNVRFPSYAVWWIKAYIIRYLINNWRLVKIGTTQAQRKLFFNLEKEREKLEREGFYPTPKLLAEKLDVREKDVVEMQQRLAAGDMSVDAPLGSEDGDMTMHSLIPSNELSAEEMLARAQAKRLLRGSLDEFAATLNKKELAIFKKRLLGEQKATLHDLAEEFGLSRERIRQIENRIKEKLKEFLLGKFGNSIEEFEG